MIVYSVVMIIISILTFITGILIYNKVIKNKKINKKKRKFIGQKIMIISIAPLISAIASLTTPKKVGLIIALIVLTLSVILCYIIADKYLRKPKLT